MDGHHAPAPDPAGLLVDADRADDLRAASRHWPSATLDAGQLADFELLANGGFAPLRGYLEEADHVSVRTTRRLADGTLWPVPLSLAVPRESDRLDVGDQLALRDPEGTMLGVLTVRSRWAADGDSTGRILIGGPVEALHLPNQYDHTAMRRSPDEAAAAATESRHARVAGLTTRLPLLGHDLGDLRHVIMTTGARIMVLAMDGPGPTNAPELGPLVRALQAGLDDLPRGSSLLTVVSLRDRPDDPVGQALLEAIVARRHGATHVWAPQDIAAEEALRQHANEIGVTVIGQRPAPTPPLPDVEEVRRRLLHGDDLPGMVAPDGVLEVLRQAWPPRHRRGLTVFFTGLSGSGKSTVANIVASRLRGMGERRVTLLDGDLVRHHLSSELGFSREHRNVNVLRIGWVAAEITRHGGLAICAPIAPYDEVRREVRSMVEATGGGMVLVHVATPLDVCEARDRKGLYARARAGEIPEFTGISDPYEPPRDADLALDTTDLDPHEAAQRVIDHLADHGWIRP